MMSATAKLVFEDAPLLSHRREKMCTRNLGRRLNTPGSKGITQIRRRRFEARFVGRNRLTGKLLVEKNIAYGHEQHVFGDCFTSFGIRKKSICRAHVIRYALVERRIGDESACLGPTEDPLL